MSKWEMVKLGDVCTVNPPKKQIQALYENKVVSFIPMSEVTEDGIVNTSINRLYTEVSSGFTYFIENDILFAKITPCMENGKGGIARGLMNGLGVGSTEFHVLRPNIEYVISDWIFRFVSFSKFRKLAEKNMTGSAGQKRVPKGFLENVLIPLPPLENQKQISKTLDTAAELLSMRKQQLAELDNLIKSTFYDMFGDPVANEKGWEICIIKDLATKIQYGSSQKASVEKLSYPILRMNNLTYQGNMDYINLKYIDLSEKDKEKYLVNKGDMLFNRTNSKELVGKTAVYREDTPMAYAGYLVRLVPNQKANSEFISSYLNSSYGKKLLFKMAKNIVGMANINAQELSKIKIYMPPIQLQTQFATIVTKIEEQKNLVKKAIDETQYLFDSLMSEYFE